jgi:uncharacterized protein
LVFRQLNGHRVCEAGDDLSPRAEEEFDMAISKDLLDILACPKCKGDIHLNQNNDGLVCEACRLMYPIKDDIPIMLIDEAVRL